MDPMLQRHCARYIYAIPDGLRELMSDISREVLRTQPPDTYTFIADYLDALLITRENARVGARLIEIISEIGTTIAEFLTRTGLTREEADMITSKIQTAFRRHLEKQKCVKLAEETEAEEMEFLESITEDLDIENMQSADAALIIQRAYQDFKEREAREKDLLRGIVDWRVAARSTIQLYRRTGVTFAEANRAATLIKAAYKGYYTRRVMRRLLEQGAKEYAEALLKAQEEEEEPGEDDEWGWCYCFVEEQAASEIQDEYKTAGALVEAEDSMTDVQSVLSSIIKIVIPSELDFETEEMSEGEEEPTEMEQEQELEEIVEEAPIINEQDLLEDPELAEIAQELGDSTPVQAEENIEELETTEEKPSEAESAEQHEEDSPPVDE